MRITFIGAAHEVTGSCTLIEACGRKIIADCGLEQGKDIYKNCEIPVSAGDVDAILLTHAHIDHSGMIPALSGRGFNKKIYTTGATAMLCDIMLRDSAHIQESDAEWKNRKAKRAGGGKVEPLYTLKDVEKTQSCIEPCSYHRPVEIFDGIEVTFTDAGHLLGSSSIFIKITEEDKTRTLLFSGDSGNMNRPLINDPEKPDEADYVVIESTYGDRIHKKQSDNTAVFAEIRTLSDISGHSDRDMLISWLGNLKRPPEKVFVNHGDDKVCDIFAGHIKEKLGFDAVAPFSGGAYEL